jgi:hypothetical protein
MPSIADRMRQANQGDSGIMLKLKRAITDQLTEERFGDYLVGVTERGELPSNDNLDIFFGVGLPRTGSGNIAFYYNLYDKMNSTGSRIEGPVFDNIQNPHDYNYWQNDMLATHIESIIKDFEGIKVIGVTCGGRIDDDSKCYFHTYHIKIVNPLKDRAN